MPSIGSDGFGRHRAGHCMFMLAATSHIAQNRQGKFGRGSDGKSGEAQNSLRFFNLREPSTPCSLF